RAGGAGDRPRLRPKFARWFSTRSGAPLASRCARGSRRAHLILDGRSLDMKLIIAKPSPYARKARAALLEKSIPFETEIDAPWNPDTEAPRLNPLGKPLQTAFGLWAPSLAWPTSRSGACWALSLRACPNSLGVAATRILPR